MAGPGEREGQLSRRTGEVGLAGAGQREGQTVRDDLTGEPAGAGGADVEASGGSAVEAVEASPRGAAELEPGQGGHGHAHVEGEVVVVEAVLHPDLQAIARSPNLQVLLQVLVDSDLHPPRASLDHGGVDLVGELE